MNESSKKNKLIAKNTLMLFGRMLLIMAVTLYTSRVLLKFLGVEDFGIYNVVGSVVLIFSSISASMNSASNRFLIYALGKNDIHELKKTFRSILTIHLILGLAIFILIEIVGLYLLKTKLIIPDVRANAALWVFHLTAISIIFLFISYPFHSLIIAHEQMSAFAIISILDAFLRLGIVFLLPYMGLDRLVAYGILVLSVQVIIQLLYVIYCKTKFSETDLKFAFNKTLFFDMSKFMGWIFFGNLSYVGYTQGINILLNMFFGPATNAARAIAVQVQSAVTKFSDSFQTAIRPQITIAYAQEDFNRLHSLIDFGSRISFSLMASIFLPIVFTINIILKIWLEKVPQGTNTFVLILLLISIFRSLGAPLLYAIQAKGCIKKVQIMESICLILSLPIAFINLKFASGTANSIFLICLLFEVLSFLGKIILILPEVNISYSYYIKNIVWPIVLTSISSPIIPFFLYKFYNSSSILSNILMIASSIFSLAICIYIFMLKKNEKIYIRNAITKKI